MAILAIRDVSKSFGRHTALDSVSLTVNPGEFVSLLGPSGCGKTTLLRLVAGFLQPSVGSIEIDGRDVTALPPNKRPLNTVFQNYALFPHMTFLQNVAYGPLRAGVAKQDARSRALEALEMVGLVGLQERYPREASGGQQQRAALARAIVNRPKLLLLDEPLSALDLQLRRRMQIELKQLQERIGIAFIFVTHDQEEAMTMSDRIVVMNAGSIEQIGTGNEIYRAPETRFVAEFIGEANFFFVSPSGCDLAAQPDGFVPSPGSRIAVVRPEHVEVTTDADVSNGFSIGGIVETISGVGGVTSIRVRAGNGLIIAKRLGMEVPIAAGQAVRLCVARHNVHVIGR